MHGNVGSQKEPYFVKTDHFHSDFCTWQGVPVMTLKGKVGGGWAVMWRASVCARDYGKADIKHTVLIEKWFILYNMIRAGDRLGPH